MCASLNPRQRGIHHHRVVVTLAIPALHYQNNNPAEADTGANLGKQLCYIVFDLLFVNGQSVMELTLAQRMALLERCIPKPQPKILEIVQQVPIHSIDDIISYARHVRVLRLARSPWY